MVKTDCSGKVLAQHWHFLYLDFCVFNELGQSKTGGHPMGVVLAVGLSTTLPCDHGGQIGTSRPQFSSFFQGANYWARSASVGVRSPHGKKRAASTCRLWRAKLKQNGLQLDN